MITSMDHAYDIMTGGAAAALTGLLFVALSLHARAIVHHRFFGNRAIGTLMSLLTQLFLAAAALVPGQSRIALGIEVEAAALFFLVFTTRAVIRLGRYGSGSLSRSRWRARLEGIGGAIWITLFVASGISLMIHAGGGFYLLAIVMLFMFGWNVYIAWVLITELAE